MGRKYIVHDRTNISTMSKIKLTGKTYFTGKPVSIIFKKTKHKNLSLPLRRYMRDAGWIKELSYGYYNISRKRARLTS